MRRKLPLLITFVLLLVAPRAFSAEILKVKGMSVLIDLKGDAAAPGDVYYAVDGGKKRALIQISKVKGEKAIGHITKGKAAPGMALEAKPSGGNGVGDTASKSTRKSSMPSGRKAWGVLVGYAMDDADVKVLWQTSLSGQHNVGDTKEIAHLTGSGYSAMGMFDYGFSPNFWVRALGGFESINFSGDAACGAGNNETCNSKIAYLSADGLVRWLFLTGDIRPWLGAGVGMMFPVTKSSTAFSSSSISSTQVILFQGGVDWSISKTMYIPVSLEYGLLPKSSEVDAHWIELRVGVGIPF